MQGFEDLFCLNIYNTNFTRLSTVQRRSFGFVIINEALNFDFELRLFFFLVYLRKLRFAFYRVFSRIFSDERL